MAAKMIWDVSRFFAEWERIKRRGANAATYFVRFKARRLGQALAYHTPLAARRFQKHGRARYGWWPAIAALGGRSAYTPYRGPIEGRIVDQSRGADPRITMVNAVPYITLIPGGAASWEQAMAQETANARDHLEACYRKEWAPWLR